MIRFKGDDWIIVKTLNMSSFEEGKAVKLMPRFEGSCKIF